MDSGTLFVSLNGNKIENTNIKENFKEVGLHEMLLNNLNKMNFEKMTPIQKNVIPIITEGNDVMACSQTGSGKTIAFLSPIVNKMLNEGPPNINLENFPSAPVALILIPTRELAEQIYKEGRKLLHQTGVHITKIYGGVPHDSQIRELREGTDILVATPGRLIDFLNSKLITLKAVKYLILDEADRILDLGFSDQLNTITLNYGKFLLIFPYINKKFIIKIKI
jgi:ATP-dependent RNA helicase DDX3X